MLFLFLVRLKTKKKNMIFTGNISFIYIILFIIVYNISSLLIQKKEVLNFLLVIGNLIILTTIVNISTIGILTVISALVFFCGKFLNNIRQHNKLYLSFFISILIVLFVIKNYKITDLELLQRVGLSYILFRLIHFLIDSHNNKIHNHNLWVFLNYILFFPTFIAGPIDNYNNFAYWVKQKRNTYKSLLIKAGSFKLMIGIIKKFFIVPIILSHAIDFSMFDGNLIWQLNLLISLVMYSLYIYLDFSGYSDIAIGTAYLIGIKTPENFNNPYFSSSLAIFWRRWHMTFSDFLFKYIFKPIVINLSKYFKNSPRLLISSVGYMSTFMICGIWHGNTLNFFYWGLWHGIGLIFFKLWDVFIYQKKISLSQNLVFKRIYKTIAIFITFSFVTLGWLFFNYTTSDINLILENITAQNSKEIDVSTVIINKKLCFKIEFQTNDASHIDIEYKSSKSNKFRKHYHIPSNSENIYYFESKESIKDLLFIRVRSSDKEKKGEWHSVLTYLYGKEIIQSKIEEEIFGKRAKLVKMNEVPENFIEYKRELPLEHLYQNISAKALFINDYGWAIEIKYLPLPNFKVNIEYKYENGDWLSYQKNRDGKYNFVHIHGNRTFNKTSRNLKPGIYEVRIQYTVNLKSNIWFTKMITVHDYDNSKNNN